MRVILVVLILNRIVYFERAGRRITSTEFRTASTVCDNNLEGYVC
jgi:hypothetical protein